MSAIDEIFNNPALRKKLLAFRIPIALLFVVALLMNVNAHWYWPGLVVSSVGMLLQLWVFGCIRTREVLAVNGPYMFVRNPMYIARFLLILGLVLMTGIPWLLLIYVPLYYFYMVNRVEREEVVLQETFGTDYHKYCREVPRFLPRLKPYSRGRFWYFKVSNFDRQHGTTNLVVFIVLYVLCYIAAFHLNL